MQELFGEQGLEREAPPGDDPAFVRRKQNRGLIELGMMRKGLPTSTDRHNLQIMILHLEPGGDIGKNVLSYPAQNGGMVFSGEVLLRVDDDEVTFYEGISFVFDRARPHSLRNIGDTHDSVQWVIGAVQFDRHL